VEEEEEEEEAASKILSFAAMHGIPGDIASCLLRSTTTTTTTGKTDDDAEEGGDGDASTLEECARRFEEGGGWESVSFPRGLSLLLRRRLYRDDKDAAGGATTEGGYFPRRRRRRLLLLPSFGRRHREAAVEEASYARMALRRAASARPPERRISREELFAALDEAIGGARGAAANDDNMLLSETSSWSMKRRRPRAVVGEFKFFPEREERARLWKKAVHKATGIKLRMNGTAEGWNDRLAGLGKGGLLSYGFLNFAWYTLAVGWQWSRFRHSPTQLPRGTAGAIILSVRKFIRVFLSAYVGSQVTKLPRLYTALMLAPMGNRTLRYVERRWNVNERTAFGTVTGLLVGGCLSIWAMLIFGDALISSAGTFSM